MPVLRRTEQTQVFLQEESEMNETGPEVEAREKRNANRQDRTRNWLPKF